MQRFEKYEGLGNDFIVIDASEAARISPADARRWCRRRFGVGADGVLLVLPPLDASAVARMLVLNADGSRPEMCGNGLRCVALHLHRTGKTQAEDFLVETDAGPKRCLLRPRSDGALVQLSLGAPRHGAEFEHEHAGLTRSFSRVSMGNPHAVWFGEALSEAEMDAWGAAVSARFAEGTNVEYARLVAPHRLELVVWERGVGRTLACGTGAGATVAAAVRAGLVGDGQRVEVTLPGGRLDVWTDPASGEVWLEGPARHVYTGSVALP